MVYIRGILLGYQKLSIDAPLNDSDAVFRSPSPPPTGKVESCHVPLNVWLALGRARQPEQVSPTLHDDGGA